MPKMLDLFCGTKSVSKEFAAAGWETYTVDWEKSFQPTLCADIGTLSAQDIINLCGGVPDVVWMSPDCTSYSVAAIGRHRRKNLETDELDPVSDYAKQCDKINAHIIDVVVNQLKPKYWFIENPRGGMRKMRFVKDFDRYTVTYCQYGDRRMKPTDIWTNHQEPGFLPPCRNGSPCHEPSPRGSRSGTAGLRNSVDRARIPEKLCQHIVEICDLKDEGNAPS